jgi:hypothetical protein
MGSRADRDAVELDIPRAIFAEDESNARRAAT